MVQEACTSRHLKLDSNAVSGLHRAISDMRAEREARVAADRR